MTDTNAKNNPVERVSSKQYIHIVCTQIQVQTIHSIVRLSSENPSDFEYLICT